MDLEKLSEKTLVVLMESRKAEAETLFQAALDAEEQAEKLAAEIASRGGGPAVGPSVNIRADHFPEASRLFRDGAEILDIGAHLAAGAYRRAPAAEPETPDPVMVVPDSNEPQCEGGTTHDWERIRNGPEVLLDSCRLCPVRRWVEITEEGGTLSWNYGSPPPPKQRARMMQEDDELEEGEEWEDADGNVPREITGRQKKLTRVTDGRRVTVDP